MERTAQWRCILWIGPIFPVTQTDFQSVVGRGHGEFRGVVGGVGYVRIPLFPRLEGFVKGGSLGSASQVVEA